VQECLQSQPELVWGQLPASVQHKHYMLALSVKCLKKNLSMMSGVAHPVRGEVGRVHNLLSSNCEGILPS